MKLHHSIQTFINRMKHTCFEKRKSFSLFLLFAFFFAFIITIGIRNWINVNPLSTEVDHKLPTSSTSSNDSSTKKETIETTDKDNAVSEFTTFTDQLFCQWLSGSTLDLHYVLATPENYNITPTSITLGTTSPKDITQYYEQLAKDLERLLSFDKNTLTKNEQLTFDILLSYLQTELSVKELYLYNEPLGSVTGIQAQLPILLNEYRFYTKDDVTTYLQLLPTIISYFNSILELEKEKAEAGLFMSDALLERIIAQCQRFIEQPEENVLITGFEEHLLQVSNLTHEEKNDFINENKNRVLSYFITAYTTLSDGLTQLKRQGTMEGLCHTPNGKQYYEYLVASGTGTSKSMKELKQAIHEQIYENLSTMYQAYDNIPNAETLLEDYSYPLTEPSETLEYLKQSLSTMFPTGPDVSYTVKYVPDSLEDFLSPAFYLVPPLDKMEDNVIYINGKEGVDLNKLYPTIAHEGYPGHLYQTTYFNGVNTCNLRRLMSYPGYTEGWATYVEHLSYFMLDDFDSNLASALSNSSMATLGIYALMDIGIHYDGWSINDLKEFIKDYFSIGDSTIIEEIYYTIAESPANYLSYYVGCLEILELKELMKSIQGDNFSLKEFHTELLNIGPAPFSVIEDYMTKSNQ